MTKIKIGLLKETKSPVDNRVALTPAQAQWLKEHYNVEVVAQSSDVRVFSDSDYSAHGVDVVDDVSDCDLLMGIKEVRIDSLIPEKHYVFFSHCAKLQPYNKPLAQEIAARRITLTDYEYITDENGVRKIAFGYFAGVVAVYNALRLYGMKYSSFSLPAPDQHWTVDALIDRIIEEREGIQKAHPRILVTGTGRVGHGAKYVLDSISQRMGIDFKVLDVADMVENNGRFEWDEFIHHPELYKSRFAEYVADFDILISCHFWHPSAPRYFTNELMLSPRNKIKVVADASCDICGSIECTIRPSTHSEPFYDYSPLTRGEVPLFSDLGNISVMAVDTLPNALPAEASDAFGKMAIESIILPLLNGDTASLDKATIFNQGDLTEQFAYMRDWLNADV